MNFQDMLNSLYASVAAVGGAAAAGYIASNTPATNTALPAPSPTGPVPSGPMSFLTGSTGAILLVAALGIGAVVLLKK